MSNTVNNVYQNMLKVYQNGLTQSATAEYVLTSVDIVNGFVAVPVVWDMPWLDLDIAITFSIKDLGTNGPSLDYVQGDMHDITTSGFTSIVDIFGAIPLVQSLINAIDVDTPQSVNYLVPLNTLYMVTIYIASLNTGSVDDAIQTYITFTDATNQGPQTFGYGTLGQILGSGGSLNSQNFTFPLYCIAGSSLLVTTAFVLAGTDTPTSDTFAYDFSSRVVQMPINSNIPSVGDLIIINALSFHKEY